MLMLFVRESIAHIQQIVDSKVSLAMCPEIPEGVVELKFLQQTISMMKEGTAFEFIQTTPCI